MFTLELCFMQTKHNLHKMFMKTKRIGSEKLKRFRRSSSLALALGSFLVVVNILFFLLGMPHILMPVYEITLETKSQQVYRFGLLDWKNCSCLKTSLTFIFLFLGFTRLFFSTIAFFLLRIETQVPVKACVNLQK